MGGAAGLRGYLVQTIVGLLVSLDESDAWSTVTLEPDDVSEKVDILWRYADRQRAAQVKSSATQISKSAAESWARELAEARDEVDTRELVLVGPCAESVSKLGEFEGVRIPPPLNITGLEEQAAHRLGRFLEHLPTPLRLSSKARELLVGALISWLERISTEGQTLSRASFTDQIVELAESVRQHGQRRLLAPPALPPHFLPRLEDLAGIRTTLLSENQKSAAITGKASVGLHGMGGIGKSVLAAAVASDAEIVEEFPDGVFWLAIGQTPNVVALQTQLARALGEDSPVFDSIESGKAALKDMIGTKACLIVLDDVWQAEHALAFPSDLYQARTLLTTRDASLISKVGASEHRLEVLSEQQATSLLSDWSGVDPEDLPNDAHRVASECGHLPLALATCGAMVRDGVFWSDILAALRDADLDYLDEDLEYSYRHIVRSLQVSLDALERVDPQAVQRYRELAVFPEDLATPETAILTLWKHTGGLTDRDARKLLSKLERKALLRLQPGSLGLVRQMTLHDLQRDFLVATSKDMPGQHALLLDAYSAQCAEGWASGPDDGYFFQQLVGHFQAAGQQQEYHQLLANYDWLRAKLEATSVAQLLDDFRFAEEDFVSLIRDAIRIGAPYISHLKDQLPSQLYGRMKQVESPESIRLLRDIQSSQQTWLRTLRPVLTPPGGPLIRTLIVSQELLDIAVTPDGEFVVSSSEWESREGDPQHEVIIQALNSTSPPHELQAPVAPLRIQVTPDGKQVVGISSLGLLMVWNCTDGQLLEQNQIPNLDYKDRLDHYFRSQLVLKDSATAFVALGKNRLMAVDVRSGAPKFEFVREEGKFVYGLAYSPVNDRLASLAEGFELNVWDAENGSLIWSASPVGEAQFRAVTFTADGAEVITAMSDGALQFWDAESGQANEHTPAGHSGEIDEIVLTGGGARLVTTSSDRTLCIWDVEQRRPIRSLSGHSSNMCRLAAPLAGEVAVSAPPYGSIKVWDLQPDSGFQFKPAKASWVAALTASNGELISASLDGSLTRWSADGESTGCLPPAPSGVKHIALSPNGQRLAVASNSSFTSYDLSSEIVTAKTLRDLSALDAPPPPNRVSINDEGQAILALANGELEFWDVQSGQRIRKSLKGPAWVRGWAIAQQAGVALSAGYNGVLTLWDLNEGLPIRNLHGSCFYTSAIAIAEDASLSVTCSENGDITVWDLPGGKMKRQMSQSHYSVAEVAISSDGEQVLTVSRNNTLGVWDLLTGESMAFFGADHQLMSGCIHSGPQGNLYLAGDVKDNVYFLALEQ